MRCERCLRGPQCSRCAAIERAQVRAEAGASEAMRARLARPVERAIDERTERAADYSDFMPIDGTAWEPEENGLDDLPS